MSTSLKLLNNRTQDLRHANSILDILLLSLPPVRWVGFVLIAMAVLDMIAMLVGMQPMNPQWEFETYGQLVERSPVPLLGVALVMIGREKNRKQFEFPLLKAVSWACLVGGVTHLLLLPLSGNNALRLNQAYEQTYQLRIDQVTKWSLLVEERVEAVSNSEEMITLLRTVAPTQSGQLPSIVTSEELEAIRQQLREAVEKKQKEVVTQAGALRVQQRNQLFKRSIAWFPEGLIVGILFLALWRYTRWARAYKPERVVPKPGKLKRPPKPLPEAMAKKGSAQAD